jgi:hypothetical protein
MKSSSSSSSSNRDNYEAFWGVDSEFMKSGRRARASDVHSIQFSNGIDSHFFIESASQLKRFFKDHRYIKKMYAFNLPAEVGSFRSMLAEGDYETHDEANKHSAVKFDKIRNRKICEIRFVKELGFNCVIYDIQGLCSNLGFRNLKSIGKYLQFPKDEPPSWLGYRKWETEDEKEIFVKYSLRDAQITSQAARMLKERWKIDPEIHVSVGTVAKEVFQFPHRLEKRNGLVYIPPLEDNVRKWTFGGRSECFKTGYIEDVYYNDVKSLYPASMLATRCLQITGAEECQLSDLDITGEIAPDRYGWIDGYFETNNELWGLPRRAKNNIYMTGKFAGFYHTFDLAAAKAKVIDAYACYRPRWNVNALYHEKLAKMFEAKLNGKLSKEDNIFYKAVMNSASGKLGQGCSYWKYGNRKSSRNSETNASTTDGFSSFPATTSNYFAYNTLLAHSHYTMSRLYDFCKAKYAKTPIYTDTDSIMLQGVDMSGTHFEYDDGVRKIPITLDVKAHGNLSLFRSKRYILDVSEDVDGYVKDGFAYHGWKYDRDSFLALRYGNVGWIDTRMSIKSTAHTRVKDALKMELGRWYNRPVRLGYKDIVRLLSSDTKRNRGCKENYNSYRLVSERKSVDSVSWTRANQCWIPDEVNSEFYEQQFSELEF